MKKKVSLILIFCLLLTFFVACGKNGDKPEDSDKNESVVTSENNATEISSDNSKSDETASSSDSEVKQVGAPVEDSFFDDAVFVGDSVTLKLSYYVDFVRNAVGNKCLGQSKFLCAGSLGYANSLWDINQEGNVHPYYEGTQYLIADGVKAIGAKKVFIMLGVNDFAIYGADSTAENAETVINKILEKSPDAEIYVQSITPMIKKVESDSYNNENIRKLNEKLKEMCKKNSWIYLDIASVMTDENGYLKSEYCSDPDDLGIHFTNDACEKWVEYLMENAGYDYSFEK